MESESRSLSEEKRTKIQMAKITFDSSNKVKQFNDYPKLKFEAKGEKARVVVLDDAPEVAWVHTLRAPVIVNGTPVMEKVTNKEGQIVGERPKMDFIGQHVCFGNDQILAEKFKDPANCPTCAAGNESDAVEPPRRRMAIHIVRYKTQPGSFKPQEPFQAELLAWVFGEKVFDSLVSISEEHGDLRMKDLLLECSNKMFQNVEVQVGGSAAWLETDANKEFVKALYAANKCEDFIPLLARKATRQQAEEDIAKVKLRHAQAFGGTTEAVGSAPSVSETSAAVNLDDILSGPSETVTGNSVDAALGDSAPAAPVAASAGALDDLLGGGSSEAAAAPAAVAVEASAGEPTSAGNALDFDSLIAGL